MAASLHKLWVMEKMAEPHLTVVEFFATDCHRFSRILSSNLW
jgi:hypothetical protein